MTRTIAWRLLRDAVGTLEELERYTGAIDSYARNGGDCPELPEGLTRRVTDTLNEARLALAVHAETLTNGDSTS